MTAATQADASAQTEVGRIYLYGAGTEKDSEQAFYCYSIAAHRGLDRVQCNLALLYEKGLGIEQDAK